MGWMCLERPVVSLQSGLVDLLASRNYDATIQSLAISLYTFQHLARHQFLPILISAYVA